MKKIDKNQAIILGVLILSFLVLFFISLPHEFDELKGHRVIDRQDSINSKIIKYKALRGGAIITTTAGEKFSIPFARNLDYTISDLDHWIKIGDYVVKRQRSDTIWVFRDGDETFFVIGKVIGSKNNLLKNFKVMPVPC